MCIPLAGGGSTVRSEEMDWGWDMPDQDPHLLPSFDGALFSSRYSVFQQVQHVIGQWDTIWDWVVPPHPVVWSNSSSWWYILLQTPVDNSFYRFDGAWCSQQHRILIHGESRGNGFFSQLLHLYVIGFLSRGPRSVYWATGPIDWSFNCVKAWDDTLAHPGKVILSVNSIICCFNIPLSLSTNCCLWVIGELEAPFNVMLFCPTLHIITFEMRPPIIIYSVEISIHSTVFLIL